MPRASPLLKFSSTYDLLPRASLFLNSKKLLEFYFLSVFWGLPSVFWIWDENLFI